MAVELVVPTCSKVYAARLDPDGPRVAVALKPLLEAELYSAEYRSTADSSSSTFPTLTVKLSVVVVPPPEAVNVSA